MPEFAEDLSIGMRALGRYAGGCRSAPEYGAGSRVWEASDTFLNDAQNRSTHA